MEVTAAERTAIYTNISPLAQRVNNYIQTQHSSIAAVAKDIGYSRTTVSRYLTGKYDSNPNDLESKLTDFLTRQTGEAVDLTTPLAKSEGKTWQTPVFFESRDAKAVLGVQDGAYIHDELEEQQGPPSGAGSRSAGRAARTGSGRPRHPRRRLH